MFHLFDNNIKLEHPSVRNTDFHKYGDSDSIRTILHELCENRSGKWFFKNHDSDTLYDLYQQFDDQEVLNLIQADIEQAKQDTLKYFSQYN